MNWCGAQRARQLRPRCMGTVRSRTEMLINQSINHKGLLRWGVKFQKCENILNIYRIYSRNSRTFLTLILLTWRIWWVPNNASKRQMEFNSAFRGLTKILYLNLGCVIYARKRFYVNKSGYTGNFFKNIVLKAWITRVNTVIFLTVTWIFAPP